MPTITEGKLVGQSDQEAVPEATASHTLGSFHENVTLKNDQIEIVFDRLWYPLSILLLAAIGVKLIGPQT